MHNKYSARNHEKSISMHMYLFKYFCKTMYKQINNYWNIINILYKIYRPMAYNIFLNDVVGAK